MKFTLLEIDVSLVLIFYIAGILLGLIVFYYMIKAAVKNGIIEAKSEMQSPQVISKLEKVPNSKQTELQNKYDKGEISFAEYKIQWDKLS